MGSKRYKPRRLKEVPLPDSAVGQLAQALRAARQAKGLTQEQAGDAMDISSSTVQRAEAGKVAPEKYVVDRYVTRLGLNSVRAEQLWAEANRPAGRRRRVLTPAPAVHLIKTDDDLGGALQRVWQEHDEPSAPVMERRAEIAHQQDKATFSFLSRSAAWRLSHRRQLPSSVRQLRSYLYACGVPEGRFQIWIEAHQRVKAKQREEAMAKKKAKKEAGRQWRGWEGRSRAEACMRAAGLDPVEAPPRSATAPWSVRCRRCGGVRTPNKMIFEMVGSLRK